MGNLRKHAAFSAEEAEKEQQELEAGGGADFMQLKVGRNVVRVLPPPPGERSPFKVVYQHFINLPGSTGPASFVCPRLTLKQSCPACSEADRLRGTGNPADADMANDLFARRRVFTNVIDRGAPEKGPRVMAFGKTIHEQLLALRTDPDSGGNYTDPDSGFDIIISRTGTGKNDTKYTVSPARGNSPLASTEEQMDEWYDAQRPLESFARVASPDEIRKMLRGEKTERNAAPAGRALPAGRTEAAAPRRPNAQDAAIDAEYEEAEA